MTTISVIIIGIIFITIIGFGAQGRSELYHILRSKPLATGRQTPNQQYSHGRRCSRPQPQWGGAGGNPHHREPQGGGGIPWGGGGRGGLAALHHIYMRYVRVSLYIFFMYNIHVHIHIYDLCVIYVHMI